MQPGILSFIFFMLINFNMLGMEKPSGCSDQSALRSEITCNEVFSKMFTLGEYLSLTIPPSLGKKKTVATPSAECCEDSDITAPSLGLSERTLSNETQKWACTSRACDGRTLLFFAKQRSIQEKILAVIDYHTPVNNNGITPLIDFIQSGNTEAAISFIDLYIQAFKEWRSKSGSDEIDKRMALHKLKMALDYPTKRGTPLFFAVTEGNDAVVRKLVQCGAYVNPLQKNGIGQSPFTKSLELGRATAPELCALLKQKIARIKKMRERSSAKHQFNNQTHPIEVYHSDSGTYKEVNEFIRSYKPKGATHSQRTTLPFGATSLEDLSDELGGILKKFNLEIEKVPLEFFYYTEDLCCNGEKQNGIEKILSSYRDVSGRTLLYYANKIPAWSFILRNTDYLVPVDARGNTPLLYFLQKGAYKEAHAFSVLLIRDYAVFARKSEAANSLKKKALKRRMQRIEQHLLAPDLLGSLPLHLALLANHFSLFELLYKSSFLPKEALVAKDAYSNTPLALSYKYCPKAIPLLLAEQAVVDSLFSSPTSLLIKCILKGHLSFFSRDADRTRLFLKIPFNRLQGSLQQLFEYRFSKYTQDGVIYDCAEHAATSENSKEWLKYLKALKDELEDEPEWSVVIEKNMAGLLADWDNDSIS